MGYVSLDEQKLIAKIIELEQRIQTLESQPNAEGLPDKILKPGESIQAAIDDPSTPRYIALKTGIFKEDVVINHPLRLEGVFWYGTELQGRLTIADYVARCQVGNLELNGLGSTDYGLFVENPVQSVPTHSFYRINVHSFAKEGLHVVNASDCTFNDFNIGDCAIGAFIDIPFALAWKNMKFYDNHKIDAHIRSQGFSWDWGVIAAYHPNAENMECNLKLESCLGHIKSLWIENQWSYPNIDMVGPAGKYGANRALKISGWFHNNGGDIIRDRAYGILYQNIHMGPGKGVGHIGIHKLEGYGHYVNVEADNLEKSKVEPGASLLPLGLPSEANAKITFL